MNKLTNSYMTYQVAVRARRKIKPVRGERMTRAAVFYGVVRTLNEVRDI